MGPFTAGQILIVDWRGDGLPKEPNKLRPCVVIEDTDLFDALYPNVVLVPLTEDENFGIAGLIVEITPTPKNGCTRTCYAVSHCITTASKRRIKQATSSRITDEQLVAVRRQAAESIGL